MNIDWSIERYDEVRSTQDVLKDLAADGVAEGRVVVASAQTNGRGRHGREWISQAGNLYFSVLLRPDSALRYVGQLSLVVGAALGKALRLHVEHPDFITLKWPNDVLLDGKKCAGILIETGLNQSNELEWVAVGIGVNTVSALEIGAALNVDSEEVLQSILGYLDEYYALWVSQGFESILNEWHIMAHPEGTEMSVKLGDKIVAGRFYKVDDQGNLLLHGNDNSLQTITAGEVYIQD